jgi:hypothetical protein
MKKTTNIAMVLTAIICGISLPANASGENKGKCQGNEPQAAVAVADSPAVNPNGLQGPASQHSKKMMMLDSLEGNLAKETAPAKKYDFYYDDDDRDEQHHKMYKRNRFRGHWTGIELGMNNYALSDGSFGMPGSINYMTLNSAKSVNFNINFTQVSIELSRHLGLVSGLGFNWNNYRFDGNNSITLDPSGSVEMLDPGVRLEKSKLATLYLVVPLLAELQLPAHGHYIILAAGPVGALKLSSHTKMVYEGGHTEKNYGDFNLNMLRHGFTGRIGYQNFQIYATYYQTPLFESGKGPGGYDLFPFEVGLAFTFND